MDGSRTFPLLRNFGVTAAKTRTTHSAGSKISTRHSVSFIYFISCYLSGHCWKKAVSCCRSSGQQSGLCSSTVIKGWGWVLRNTGNHIINCLFRSRNSIQIQQKKKRKTNNASYRHFPGSLIHKAIASWTKQVVHDHWLVPIWSNSSAEKKMDPESWRSKFKNRS